MAKPNQQHKEWGTSYGEMVWREFAKSRFTMFWLGFIIFLFVLAIFAPFFANDKPFVIRIDGQLRFPLFADLNATDYSVFLAAILAVVQLLLINRNQRRVDPSIRAGVLWRQISVNVVILFVGIALLYVFMQRRLDATDYNEMLTAGKATNAVFPLVPYGYGRTDLKVREQPPNKQHWLGTDDVGSDVLCRIIHGSRISLSVGFVAVGISSIIGVIIGAILGYFGGKADFLGMRLVEIMMAVPVFFLIITCVAFFPRSLFNIMLIIGLTTWTDDARFILRRVFQTPQTGFCSGGRLAGAVPAKHSLQTYASQRNRSGAGQRDIWYCRCYIHRGGPQFPWFRRRASHPELGTDSQFGRQHHGQVPVVAYLVSRTGYIFHCSGV